MLNTYLHNSYSYIFDKFYHFGYHWLLFILYQAMTEFSDNRLQKVPQKEVIKNMANKIKSVFFKIGIQINKNP